MYKLHGSTWVRTSTGKQVAAQEVSDYLAQHAQGGRWSTRALALAFVAGFFALALIGLVVKIAGWAIGVIIGSLELLIALAALAMLVWGAIWLFRKLAHNIQESPDSDQNPVRNLLERLRKNVRASMSSRTKEVNS